MLPENIGREGAEGAWPGAIKVLAEQPVDSLPHICGFRHMPSTDSDACRPPIPTHAVHRFRPMSSTLMGGHWRGFGTSGREEPGGRGRCWMT